MTTSRLNPLAAPVRLLRRDDMSLLGVEGTARMGRRWNARRFGPVLEARRERLDAHLARIREERAGPPAQPAVTELRDGWARDDSHSLPHLDRLLDDMDSVIEERGGQRWPFHGKPFLFDILPEEASGRWPSILDFVTTADVVMPVARHCGFVPCLSGDTPPGVRLMESTTRYDPQAEGPWRSSQLWHTDYHSFPTIYVIVALRDIEPEDGALRFMGEAASGLMAEQIGYNRRGTPHRVSDEQVQKLADPSETKTFSGPRGSVLYLDSSRCFHFGSRNPRNPRYQLQYALISPVRNDFGDLVRPQVRYPVDPGDQLSRRLALDREFSG